MFDSWKICRKQNREKKKKLIYYLHIFLQTHFIYFSSFIKRLISCLVPRIFKKKWKEKKIEWKSRNISFLFLNQDLRSTILELHIINSWILRVPCDVKNVITVGIIMNPYFLIGHPIIMEYHQAIYYEFSMHACFFIFNWRSNGTTLLRTCLLLVLKHGSNGSKQILIDLR